MEDLTTKTDMELEKYRDECYQSRQAVAKDRTGYGMAERIRLADEFKRITRELNQRQNIPDNCS